MKTVRQQMLGENTVSLPVLMALTAVVTVLVLVVVVVGFRVFRKLSRKDHQRRNLPPGI